MKQKLSKRTLRNTPTDTPQVRSNCDSVLNISESRRSVQDFKTFDNNSEEDLREQHSPDSDLRVQNIVYVLNMKGKPLMPTTQSKARRLIKNEKAETFMNTVRKRLLEGLKKKYNNIEETFGYITKNRRLKLKLDKSHVNDAFCISNGDSQERSLVYNIIQKRKNNRKLQIQRKGKIRSIRRKRYHIQPYDIITFEGKQYISKGVCNYGNSVKVKDNGKDRYLSVKRLEKVFHVKTFVYI